MPHHTLGKLVAFDFKTYGYFPCIAVQRMSNITYNDVAFCDKGALSSFTLTPYPILYILNTINRLDCDALPVTYILTHVLIVRYNSLEKYYKQFTLLCIVL